MRCWQEDRHISNSLEKLQCKQLKKIGAWILHLWWIFHKFNFLVILVFPQMRLILFAGCWIKILLKELNSRKRLSISSWERLNSMRNTYNLNYDTIFSLLFFVYKVEVNLKSSDCLMLNGKNWILFVWVTSWFNISLMTVF